MIKSRSSVTDHQYLEAKTQYHKRYEKLGEITYEIHSQELENRNTITRYREIFPEIIEVQAALMHQEQLQLELTVLKENPLLDLEEVFELTQKKREDNNKKLNQMRLDAAMGERKGWLIGYNRSIDAKELEAEKQKGIQLAREIALLTHEDVVKRNPEYDRLTDTQKKELQDCFKFAMRIKSDEIGFSPSQVGFGIRSSAELMTILNKIKGILANAGLDLNSDLMPAGETLEEKTAWFREQAALYECQIEKAKMKLMALLNSPDIRESRRHLACPESYDHIRSRLRQLVKKYEARNAEYSQLISDIIHNTGA